MLLAALAAPATLALVAALVALPEERVPATAAYLLGLGVVVLVLLLAAVRAARPARRSRFELALRAPKPVRRRLRELDRIEHDVIQGVANPLDLHRRLRPLLREIAAHRLASRHGLQLDEWPDEARRLLGDAIWEIVRPGRPVPDEATGRRLTVTELDAIVDGLEQV